MTIVLFIVYLLINGLFFFLINLLIKKTTYPLEVRFLHCRLILTTMALALIGANTFTVSGFIKLADLLINSELFSTINGVVLPARAYGLQYMLLSFLGINLLFSLAVLLTLLLVKLFCRNKTEFVSFRDLHGMEKLRHFPWFFTSRFYEENDDGDIILNSTGFNFGLWTKGMKCVFIVLFGIECAAAAAFVLWGSEKWNESILVVMKSCYLLPLAGFFITEQIQFFLECPEVEEAGTFFSENVEETLEGSMESLVNFYKQKFDASGALLYSQSGIGKTLYQDGLFSNDLGNMQLHDCSQPDVLHVIANQLRRCGITQSNRYQNAVIELLNGHSINIRDRFEGEFLPYVLAYFNFYLAQGKTALIICTKASRAEMLKNEIQRNMEQLNMLNCMWNICTADEAPATSNVGIIVCSYDELIDGNVLKANADFSEELFCVVMADGFELFAHNRVRTKQMLDRLCASEKLNQYILVTDIDSEALRSVVEKSVKTELIPFSNDLIHAGTCLMIWKEESAYKIQRYLGIGNDLSPYMGVNIPLALVAAKCDLPQIYMITEDSRGDRSKTEALESNMREVEAYLGKKLNIKSIIRPYVLEALHQKGKSMIIVYDTDNNLSNTLWKWIKYGGKDGTLIHIVSPSYMLREYFVAEFQNGHLSRSNGLNAMIPYNIGMKSCQMAMILVSLMGEGMTEQELMEKSVEYGWSYSSVESLLSDSLRFVLKGDEMHEVYEYFRFEEDKLFVDANKGFKKQTRVFLTDDNTIRDRLHARIAYAQLIINENQSCMLPILHSNIYNYYLRDQFASFDGYYYRINQISDGKIYAVQAAHDGIPQYYQISSLHLEHNQTLIDKCIDKDYVNLNLYSIDVTRTIYGYWSCSKGNDFSREYLQFYGIPETLNVETNNAYVLEIKLRKEYLGEKPEKTVLLFTFMLNALFKTLFPHSYQNILAATAYRGNDATISRVMRRGVESERAEVISSIIPECDTASVSDICIDGDAYLNVYIIELSDIEYGMVNMLYMKHEHVFTILGKYLSWYLGKDTAFASVKRAADDVEQTEEKYVNDSDAKDPSDDETDAVSDKKNTGTYLNFGCDKIPELFDALALFEFCKRAVPAFTAEVGNLEQQEAEVQPEQMRCTFCGGSAFFANVMRDGRRMCFHCKDHQLTQRDEIRGMYVETLHFFEKDYHGKMRKNIHVRFQSAESIRRVAGTVDNGRILGFYNHSNHQLMIEARGPRIAIQSTLIHELTHAWQYDNLDLRQLSKELPKLRREALMLMLLEGHAMYTEIETMRSMNETEYADRMHAITMQRKDEYGAGYRMLYSYLEMLKAEGSHMNPLEAMKRLVDDIIHGKVDLPE